MIRIITILTIALLLPGAAQARHHRQPPPCAGWFCPATGLGTAASAREAHWIPQLHLGTLLGHPSGCPARAFCGCGASVRAFGHSVRSLWLAAAWGRFPRSGPGPGKAAYSRHHVFILEHHIGGQTWMVYDANSGGHRTRIHPRSIVGYRIVDPHA